MTTFFIGIGIGLALGVIIMILSKPGNTGTETANAVSGNTESFRDSLHSAGFIEIDFDQLRDLSDKAEDESDSVYGLKRKLARFKLKNRFYN